MIIDDPAGDFSRIEARVLAHLVDDFSKRWVAETEKQLQEALTYGTAVRLTNYFPYTKRRTRPMQFKGDFYNSSTHGRIRLSVRGRQLLAAEREAAQNAIRDGDFNADGQALSKARAEIAAYMGLIEQVKAEQGKRINEIDAFNRHKTATEVMNSVLQQSTDETRRRLQNDEARGKMEAMRKTLYENFLKNPPGIVTYGDFHHDFDSLRTFTPIPLIQRKENPVTNAPQIPEEAKTRSQLIGEATHELVTAQQALEYMLASADVPAAAVHLGAGPGNGIMAEAVQTLVREQWPTLAKKALTRAKARVAKAEKAVAALLP